MRPNILSFFFFAVLEAEPRDFCMPDKHFAIEVYPHLKLYSFETQKVHISFHNSVNFQELKIFYL
jgi:hypothetical protein